LDDATLVRYARHLLLDEIGFEGQARLLQASVLVVGAGGLGSPVAIYLASSGVGTLYIADGDRVDASNLQRQILHREGSVGLSKVASAQVTLAQVNPQTRVIPIGERLSGDLLDQTVARVEVVVDCSDNFATRHALNRACVRYRIPLVSGAAIRFDGQLAVFDARRENAPCYHCLFPESAAPQEEACATLGVYAPLTGIVGTLQAAEALKLAGAFGQPRLDSLLLIEGRSLQFHRIDFGQDPACPVCRATGGAVASAPACLRPGTAG
jgi:adenylyltransferase/sulfurtransferase